MSDPLPPGCTRVHLRLAALLVVLGLSLAAVGAWIVMTERRHTAELAVAHKAIVAKERLIRAVMVHYGWTRPQIDAIATGAVPYDSPEARPEGDR